MAIQSLGVGSGMDIGSLVKQLVAAEGGAKSSRLLKKEADVQQKISAMGSLKGMLSEFRSSYLSLKLASSFNKVTPYSSNPDIFNASSSGTTAATGSYSIEVLQLAKEHKLASPSVASAANVLGTGTLTFDFGRVSGGAFIPIGSQKTVTITDGSLTGIRDAINAAKIGVSASVVSNGTGYQLVMTSESGASKTMRVSVSGDSDANDSDNAGLSSLVFDPATGGIQNQTETQVAQDAQARVDGITVSGSTNTLSNIIDGVSITLKQAQIGTVGTLSVSADTAAVVKSVGDFVKSYNDLISQIKQLTFYNKDTKEKGIFLGDAVVRGIETQIKSVLNASYANPSDPSAKYSSLASLGIKTGEDKTLSFDAVKLKSILSSNLSDVKNIFMGGVYNNSATSNFEIKSMPTNLGISNLLVDVTQPATHGSYTSGVTDGSANYTMSGADILSLRVDGGTQINVSSVSGTYTPVQLAGALQTAINGALASAGQATKSVAVTYDSGTNKFSIASNTWGAASSIELVNAQGNFAAPILGFATAAVNTGVDVAGKIGNEAATGAGQTLTGTGNFSSVSLQYLGTTTDSTRFKLSKGVFNDLDSLLDRMLDGNGILSARNKGYQNTLDGIDEDRARLELRLTALQDRLIKQFTAMDTTVARLNSLSTYLSNQLPGLNSLATRK